MRPLTDILDDVRARIADACGRAGRDPASVEIIAVTKTHGAETVDEAWRAGLSIVGENKVQEAIAKKAASASGPAWHLIGRLQTNKVRAALATFSVIHSVDSLRLLERIADVAAETGARPGILLEVNVSGEASKTGFAPEAVPEAVERALSRRELDLVGLMTMAPFSRDPEDARPFFRRLRELRDALETRFSILLPRLSMGMSGDYEVAVEEGATWVRLGTVLFGERPRLAFRRDAEALDSYSGEGPTVRILD